MLARQVSSTPCGTFARGLLRRPQDAYRQSDDLSDSGSLERRRAKTWMLHHC